MPIVLAMALILFILSGKVTFFSFMSLSPVSPPYHFIYVASKLLRGTEKQVGEGKS
jgi:hypothetical protein